MKKAKALRDLALSRTTRAEWMLGGQKGDSNKMASRPLQTATKSHKIHKI
jgi:hypothetical protein